MNKYSTVSEFLADLEPAKREQVELLREIITSAQAGLAEHIKWNAPSYVLDEEDRLTFNLQNKGNQVKLVLHMGATRAEDKAGAPVMTDPDGLVAWQSNIRGIVTFTDLADIKSKHSQLTALLQRWFALN